MPTLIVAGAMAAAGHLSIGPLFAWSVAACVAPDCLWYLVGKAYGIRVLKRSAGSLSSPIRASARLRPGSSAGESTPCSSQIRSRARHYRAADGRAMRIGWPDSSMSAMGASLWVGFGLARRHALPVADRAAADTLARLGSVAGLGIGAALAGYSPTSGGSAPRSTGRCAWRGSASPICTSSSTRGARPPSSTCARSPRASSSLAGSRARCTFLRRRGAQPKDLPRDREIILYCTCPSEASAARVAKTSDEPRLQTGPPPVRRTRCLGRRGLRRGDRMTHHVVIVGAGFGGLAVTQAWPGAGCGSPSSISAIITCSSRCCTRSARRRSRPRKSPGRSAI